MSRTPPSGTHAVSREPITVYAFERNQGTVSSTFTSRLIRRVPISLTLTDGGTIDAVRYAGRYWPIFKPDTFAEMSKEWIGEGDTLYGPGYSKLKLPLEHAYLFEWDNPRSSYG